MIPTGSRVHTGSRRAQVHHSKGPLAVDARRDRRRHDQRWPRTLERKQ